MTIPLTTYTGRTLDLREPKPEDITLEDIAQGLSHVCRFAGQIESFYSVAQHSLLVSRLVPQELEPYALLHDASEAYMGDVSRNLKHSGWMYGYIDLEKGLQVAIYQRFHLGQLCLVDGQLLKAADDLAAIIERVHLREWKLVQGHASSVKFSHLDITRIHAEGFVGSPLQALHDRWEASFGDERGDVRSWVSPLETIEDARTEFLRRCHRVLEV